VPTSRQPRQRRSSSQEATLPAHPIQRQVHLLVQQQKYRQALDEIKKAHRSEPQLSFQPTEAEIWSLRGQQELDRQDFKQAETSFRRALELGLTGETHYYIARCLLALNRLDAAFDLIKKAFESDSLPKDYAICYLKLLFLKGDLATVEHLISKQSKKFVATHLHWAKGMLALKADQPNDALTHFQKIKTPTTPGDLPAAAIAYAQQQAERWDAASITLGLRRTLSFGFSIAPPLYQKSPILRRLALFQQAQTDDPPIQPSDLRQGDRTYNEAIVAMGILSRLDHNDVHNAAHAFSYLKQRPTFPELIALRPQVLILGGQLAFQGGEPKCAVEFWTPLLDEQTFNPQLAVNLLFALEEEELLPEAQRLAQRLIKWVEQDAKKNPQNWTGDRLSLTLSHLHCRLYDAWADLERWGAAEGALRQAERICPTSPEVIGRKGLDASAERRSTEAVPLLVQGLEGGCQSIFVYQTLLEELDKLKQPDQKLEVRRKFGQRFGDLNPEPEPEFVPWQEALQSQRYSFYKKMVQKTEENAPIQACRIFVDAVQGSPNSGGKVGVEQSKAQGEWDALLAKLSGTDLVNALQAIALSLHLFAKREKGIAALGNRYTLKLFDLIDEIPEARFAHLLVLVVRDTAATKLQVPLRLYLEMSPQPTQALAELQLQARRYGLVISALAPFIDQSLQREPQNPWLLLARATTYSYKRPEYNQIKEQGFELARRLQDNKALQAFRDEQAYLSIYETKASLPDPDTFDASSPGAVSGMLDSLLESMIRGMVGNKMSKAELEQMMPEMKRQLMETMPPNLMNGLPDEMDEDDFDESEFFSFGNGKKRKRDFRNL
jgi:tetratricopeptide (TPR) repeat protein